MENKQAFSQFIAAKRKEKQLTQEELAQRLYVSPTAVSKWERGISYPDITLIAGICKELGITEHEFITACDDPAAKKEKDQARKYRNMRKIFQLVCGVSYLIALVSCFICNLAIDHTLSWFFIVLISLFMSFCCTNLPFLLKRNRFLIPACAITVFMYLLLVACCLYQQGDWLFTLALPITTYCLMIFWGAVGIWRLFSFNWFFKTAALSLFLGIITAITNPLMSVVTRQYDGKDLLSVSQFFDPFYWQSSEAINKLVAWIFALYFVVGVILGLIQMKKEGKSI